MSDGQGSFDPYVPPKLEPSAIPPPSARGGRPGWLTAMCIIAIILGGLGAAGALVGIATTVAAPFMQSALTTPPNTNMDEMTRLQLEMNREQYALLARYYWGNIGFSSAHLIVATLLIVGASMCLMKKAAGRKLLLTTCGIAIVFELSRSVLQVMQMLETREIMTKFMEQMMDAMPAGGGGPSPASMMSGVMTGVIVVQIIFLSVWVLAKLIFYGSSLAYLGRPDIRMHFEGNSAVFASDVAE